MKRFFTLFAWLVVFISSLVLGVVNRHRVVFTMPWGKDEYCLAILLAAALGIGLAFGFLLGFLHQRVHHRHG